MNKPWENYKLEDKQFLINTTIANRHFLTMALTFVYSIAISITSLLISLYSMFVSLNGGFNKNLIIMTIVIGLIITFGWIFMGICCKKGSNYINCLNTQYQEIHKTIHPELFKEESKYYY